MSFAVIFNEEIYKLDQKDIYHDFIAVKRRPLQGLVQAWTNCFLPQEQGEIFRKTIRKKQHETKQKQQHTHTHTYPETPHTHTHTQFYRPDLIPLLILKTGMNN